MVLKLLLMILKVTVWLIELSGDTAMHEGPPGMIRPIFLKPIMCSTLTVYWELWQIFCAELKRKDTIKKPQWNKSLKIY